MGEALAVFGQDLENIQKGYYKAPYDMDPTHRQSSPLFIGNQMARLMKQSSLMLETSSTPREERLWLSSGMYPSYYMNTFHFQNDGWMSSDSAKVNIDR